MLDNLLLESLSWCQQRPPTLEIYPRWWQSQRWPCFLSGWSSHNEVSWFRTHFHESIVWCISIWSISHYSSHMISSGSRDSLWNSSTWILVNSTDAEVQMHTWVHMNALHNISDICWKNSLIRSSLRDNSALLSLSNTIRINHSVHHYSWQPPLKNILINYVW